MESNLYGIFLLTSSMNIQEHYALSLFSYSDDSLELNLLIPILQNLETNEILTKSEKVFVNYPIDQVEELKKNDLCFTRLFSTINEQVLKKNDLNPISESECNILKDNIINIKNENSTNYYFEYKENLDNPKISNLMDFIETTLNNFTTQPKENDFNGIIYTPPVSDEAEAWEFHLLYVPKNGYMLIWFNTSTDEIHFTSLEDYTDDPEDIAKKDIKSIIKDNALLTWLNTQLGFVLNNISLSDDTNIKSEIIDIIIKLFNYVADIQYENGKGNNIDNLPNNQKLIELINHYTVLVEDENKNNFILFILSLVDKGRERNKLIRYLGSYLNTEEKIVLRRNVHTVYQEDDISNGYKRLDHDDIKYICMQVFGKNVINDKNINDALTYIDDRLEPDYNKIRFKNGIYDMDKHELIEPEEPVFTLIESHYDYNPLAKSQYLINFLKTSLQKDTDEETAQYIKGVQQVIGYLFTSGNPLNTLIFIVGIRGGGKSIFSHIITTIFGKENISNSNLNDLGKTHGESALENSVLNIANDSANKPLSEEAVALSKQISGNDDININPKYRTPYTLNHKETPKLITVANHLGFFTLLEEAMISRFVIMEFNKIFRGTDKEDPDLLRKILKNPEEIEWLIYTGLQAYREMKENHEDFILRLDEEETKALVEKHSKPLNYLIRKLILKHDPEAWNDEIDNLTGEEFNNIHVFVNDLSENIIKLSIIKGIDVRTTKQDSISGKSMKKAIIDEFDLYDYKDDQGKEYESKSNRFYNPDGKKTLSKRYYPNLIKNNELWDTLKTMDLKELRKGERKKT